MIKNILLNLYKCLELIVKLAIFCILSLWFGYDFIIVFLMPLYMLIIYGCVMAGCLLSLLVIIFFRKHKMSYFYFAVFLGIYIVLFLYAPPVVEQHLADRCIDSGHGVWDYQEHRCRQDCLKWTTEQGCIPLPKEQR